MFTPYCDIEVGCLVKNIVPLCENNGIYGIDSRFEVTRVYGKHSNEFPWVVKFDLVSLETGFVLYNVSIRNIIPANRTI